MISLHIEAETAEELMMHIQRLALQTEPASVDEGPEVIEVADMPKPAAEAPKPRATRKKAEPAPTQEVLSPGQPGGENAKAPGFFEDTKPAAEEPTVTLEALREAANKVLEADGTSGGDKVFKEVMSCLKPDGTAAKKLSEVQEKDRAALIEKFVAMLKKV